MVVTDGVPLGGSWRSWTGRNFFDMFTLIVWNKKDFRVRWLDTGEG